MTTENRDSENNQCVKPLGFVVTQEKASGDLGNSASSNTKTSSFRPSEARLHAIALDSEAALLESNDDTFIFKE